MVIYVFSIKAYARFFQWHLPEIFVKTQVVHFKTASDLKVSVLDKFKGTLNGLTWRYISRPTTRATICTLWMISLHSSIEMAPAAVTPENTLFITCTAHGHLAIKLFRSNFKKGIW